MQNHTKNQAPTQSASSDAVYYDASQFRADTWNRLAEHARAIQERRPHAQSVERQRAECARLLALLAEVERYFAYPGSAQAGALAEHLRRDNEAEFAAGVLRVVRRLNTEAYREDPAQHDAAPSDSGREPFVQAAMQRAAKPYFEVLFVDALTEDEERTIREALGALRRVEDEFVYEPVFVRTFEDAVIACLLNTHIQSVVIRTGFEFKSACSVPILREYLDTLCAAYREDDGGEDAALRLARAIATLRPELDLFHVTDSSRDELEVQAAGVFKRVFYRMRDRYDVHVSLLKGVQARYETPFFDALRRYSKRPTGVFHALPISRAKSITHSRWITDMGDFYGPSIFMAETSATGGGLDSLLQPSGPIKRAQELAARAFGSKQTYFVTNGTSTANKIVLQGLTRPGDVVLVSRDCHKSHHYALIISGAHPVYMDPYPLHDYSMYGAVTVQTIRENLLRLKQAGKLARVRMLLLTNCTFDGVTYDPYRVMREVLAIKPDMIFVWDEAWFAYAAFSPTLRRRTAMHAAERLSRELRSPEYRAEFERRARENPAEPGWPDPDLARVRVYATQSTHKTLTSLRQGSMIHVHDQDFNRLAAEGFHEAFMTHTSTSPNYQIIASLDVGRRQVELEGYDLVQKQIELAMLMRQRIHSDPLLRRYFSVVGPKDLIPEAHRPSGLEYYYDPQRGWARMDEAWEQDEFVVDPSRVTICCGAAGIDGETLKRILIEQHDIQINKTSRNTALFMLHIGSSRGTTAYLVDVLKRIANSIERARDDWSEPERERHEARVRSLTKELPPLPNFSGFAPAFRGCATGAGRDTPEGDMRRAYYLAMEEDNCEHLKMDGTIARAIAGGREVVAACFVTPYPPGFPILVPGQIVSPDILAFLKALPVKEIHGYDAEFGLRVFKDSLLSSLGERPAEDAARVKR